MGTATGPPLPGTRPRYRTRASTPPPRIRLNGAAARLARLSANRWLSLGLGVAIAGVDLMLLSHPFGFAARALLDEPCHLATGLVVLGTVTRWRGRPPGTPFVWGLAVMSVAIDIDHLPAELAASGILYGSLPRPYTHALWTLALLILIALAAHLRGPRRPGAAFTALLFAGASWGLAAHFFRDLATAPISLLWPFSSAWLQMPYAWYLGPLVLLAVLPVPLRPRTAA